MKKTAKKKPDGKQKKAPKKKKSTGPAKKPQGKPSEALPDPTASVPAVIPEKHAGGRPSKYKPEYDEEAYRLCLLLNATDKDLAEFFDVCEATINLWKLEYPEFSESIDAGKLKADGKVAEKLFGRTQGAIWYEEVPTKVKREFYVNGKKHTEEDVIITKVMRSVPPDVRAQELWLTNRVNLKWRNRQQHEMTGKDGKELPAPQQVVLINLNDKKACEDAAREILANL